jgi:paired amphipathic helix protein Sin3a
MQGRVRFTDALSYLDEVKRQYADRPHIYNVFLDIMKDFKSQQYPASPPFFPLVFPLLLLLLVRSVRVPSAADCGGRLGIDDVIERVKELFAGQPALLEGFNLFLPPGHRVEVEGEPEVPAPADEERPRQAGGPPAASGGDQFDQAREFVKLVKCTTSPQTYKTFLELLHSYRKEQHSIRQVHDQVALLFAVSSLSSRSLSPALAPS